MKFFFFYLLCSIASLLVVIIAIKLHMLISEMKEDEMNWEQFKTILKMKLTNEEDKAKVVEIAEICQEEVLLDEEDDYQLAYQTTVCKNIYWNKLGLPKGTRKQ